MSQDVPNEPKPPLSLYRYQFRYYSYEDGEGSYSLLIREVIVSRYRIQTSKGLQFVLYRSHCPYSNRTYGYQGRVRGHIFVLSRDDPCGANNLHKIRKAPPRGCASAQTTSYSKHHDYLDIRGKMVYIQSWNRGAVTTYVRLFLGAKLPS